MELVFWGTLAMLFIAACLIGVVALYLALKNWAYDEMDIELPPKAKPQTSYWETLGDNVTLCYVCNACNGESSEKYMYCPRCGKRMSNYDKRRK